VSSLPEQHDVFPCYFDERFLRDAGLDEDNVALLLAWHEIRCCLKSLLDRREAGEVVAAASLLCHDGIRTRRPSSARRRNAAGRQASTAAPSSRQLGLGLDGAAAGITKQRREQQQGRHGQPAPPGC